MKLWTNERLAWITPYISPPTLHTDEDGPAQLEDEVSDV